MSAVSLGKYTVDACLPSEKFDDGALPIVAILDMSITTY